MVRTTQAFANTSIYEKANSRNLNILPTAKKPE